MLLLIIFSFCCKKDFKRLKKLLKKKKKKGSRLLVSTLGKQLISLYLANLSGAIDVKIDGFVLKEKSSFEILGLSFSSKTDWSSYIVYVAKTTLKKIGTFLLSIWFVSSKVPLYLNKSIVQ